MRRMLEQEEMKKNWSETNYKVKTTEMRDLTRVRKARLRRDDEELETYHIFTSGHGTQTPSL